MLDVEPACRHRPRRAHLFAHAADLAEQRVGVAFGGQHRSPGGFETFCQRGRTGDETGPRQGLVFPGPRRVAAAAGLVLLEGADRRDQQTRVAVRAQRGVDVEQLAGGGAQRQPGDQLADEGCVDLLRLLGVAGRAIVVEEDDVEVAAVAEFLAAELAVGDHRQPRLGTVALLEPRPGPAQRDRDQRVGQQRQVVGDLLHGQFTFDVTHQRAKDLGVVRAAQRVEQLFLVVFAGALQRGQAFVELGRQGRAVETLLQQPLVGQLVDDAGVAHQVLHRPARHAQQAQQAAMDFGSLGQQRDVAVAAQQRL